jgi:molecular chaperone HtpG
VVSKSAEDPNQYRWESTAGGTFLSGRGRWTQDHRGSKIILYLKPDNLEFLEERRLKDLIKKHSEFISFPIYLMVEKTNEKEVSDDEDEGEKKTEDGVRNHRGEEGQEEKENKGSYH